MKIVALTDSLEDSNGFRLVTLKDPTKIGRETPHCRKHGAMNKFPFRGIWRCLSDYSTELKEGQTKPTFRDRVCPACCIELE